MNVSLCRPVVSVAAAMDAAVAWVQANPALSRALASALPNASPMAQVGALLAVLLASLLFLRSALGMLFRAKDLPPTVACLPLVGGFLKFVSGPLPLMASAFAKHGQVFTVPLFHKRVTFLIGPEVSPHFYKVRAAHAGGRSLRTLQSHYSGLRGLCCARRRPQRSWARASQRYVPVVASRAPICA